MIAKLKSLPVRLSETSSSSSRAGRPKIGGAQLHPVNEDKMPAHGDACSGRPKRKRTINGRHARIEEFL